MDVIMLGSRVKDKISGFTGIATARTKYLNGCIRYLVEPDRLSDDGKLIEAKWFDDVQLEDIEGEGLSLEEFMEMRGGFDRPVPPSRDAIR